MGRNEEGEEGSERKERKEGKNSQNRCIVKDKVKQLARISDCTKKNVTVKSTRKQNIEKEHVARNKKEIRIYVEKKSYLKQERESSKRKREIEGKERSEKQNNKSIRKRNKETNKEIRKEDQP